MDMASCEKCWNDAYRRTLSEPMKSQTEHYHDLLQERKYNLCSPLEQAGQFWDEEKQIDTRLSKESE